MKAGFALLLRCTLVVALMAGSVSAWTPGMAYSADSEAASTASPDASGSSDSTDCDAMHGMDSDPVAANPDHERCCDEEQDCQHDSCDCACPALTLIVPTRLAGSRPMPGHAAMPELAARAPRNTIDTPLRPPQA